MRGRLDAESCALNDCGCDALLRSLMPASLHEAMGHSEKGHSHASREFAHAERQRLWHAKTIICIIDAGSTNCHCNCLPLLLCGLGMQIFSQAAPTP